MELTHLLWLVISHKDNVKEDTLLRIYSFESEARESLCVGEYLRAVNVPIVEDLVQNFRNIASDYKQRYDINLNIGYFILPTEE